jgi:hypothetical protein
VRWKERRDTNEKYFSTKSHIPYSKDREKSWGLYEKNWKREIKNPVFSGRVSLKSIE